MTANIILHDFTSNHELDLTKEHNKGRFVLELYDAEDQVIRGEETKCVGITIEEDTVDGLCAIMAHITKQEAIFFGKALTAFAEAL